MVDCYDTTKKKMRSGGRAEQAGTRCKDIRAHNDEKYTTKLFYLLLRAPPHTRSLSHSYAHAYAVSTPQS